MENKLDYFTVLQKEIIMERDGNRCVMCGKSKNEGAELYVNYINPIETGGKTEIVNGQTLCKQHLNLKDRGKKMFIRLYELSKNIGDTETQQFCASILEVFDKYNINGHIKWKK